MNMQARGHPSAGRRLPQRVQCLRLVRRRRLTHAAFACGHAQHPSPCPLCSQCAGPTAPHTKGWSGTTCAMSGGCRCPLTQPPHYHAVRMPHMHAMPFNRSTPPPRRPQGRVQVQQRRPVRGRVPGQPDERLRRVCVGTGGVRLPRAGAAVREIQGSGFRCCRRRHCLLLNVLCGQSLSSAAYLAFCLFVSRVSAYIGCLPHVLWAGWCPLCPTSRRLVTSRRCAVE